MGEGLWRRSPKPRRTVLWVARRLAQAYPETKNLKTMVHLRDDGIRPYIELEPTEHPLAVEQRNGIGVDRVAEIYAIMVHDSAA